MEVEPIDGDDEHLIVFGIVYRRTSLDAVGLRPVHVVPKVKLTIIEKDNNGRES